MFSQSTAGSTSTMSPQDRQAFSSSTSGQSTTVSDPASTLRAAALLTLKSKRRKPAATHAASVPSLSRPPPPENQFQLDYGQDDISSSPPPRAIPSASKPTPRPPSTDIEDGQIREEGEISEEEGAAPMVSKPEHTPGQTVKPQQPTFSRQEQSRFTTPPADHIILKLESPAAPNLHDGTSITPPNHSELGYGPTSTPLLDENAVIIVDADHVRPGLLMNQARYDKAKDVVLDLLGWGVPPEYLLECGLSRQIIYYVFTELNLRLPQNLDTTGIIPYVPNFERPSYSPPHSSEMPPPPVPQDNGVWRSGHSKVQIAAPGLVPDLTESSTSPSNSAQPPLFRPSPPAESSQVTTAEDLHDMERQRRQELLARKAVQASRKRSKNKENTPTNATTVRTARTASPPAQPESVDDFLKTISPVSKVIHDDLEINTPIQHRATDDMEVDDIPGLGRSVSARSIPTTSQHAINTPPSPSDAMLISPASSDLYHPQQDPPPTSASTIASDQTQTDDAVSGQDRPENEPQQRRGQKRPVASDFVDFDTVPRGHDNSTHNGYSNGGFGNSNQLIRRKTTQNSFAGISAMRRCVIDLSDSEGEADDVAMHDSEHEGRSMRPRTMAAPLRIGSLPTSAGGSRRGTPPTVSTPGILPNGTTPPASLMEKELEIQRMRELIAQREQNRLRKIAASRSMSAIETNRPLRSPTSTPAAPESNIQNAPPDQDYGSTTQSQRVHGHQIDKALDEHPSIGFSPSIMGTQGPISSSSISSIDDDRTANDNDLNGNAVRTTADGMQGDEGVVSGAEERREQVVSSTPTSAVGEGQVQSPKTDGSVDVDRIPSASTQIQMMSAHPRPDENQDPSIISSAAAEQAGKSEFPKYDSPFELYPLLRSRSRPMFSGQSIGLTAARTTTNGTSTVISTSTSSFYSPFTASPSLLSSSAPSPSAYDAHAHTKIPLIDLKPLRLAAAVKMLDPSKQICRYEVPGGGECRDAGCEDLHLGRVWPGSDGAGGVRRRGGAEPSDQDTADYLLDNLPTSWLVENGVTRTKVIAALGQVRIKNPTLVLEELVATTLFVLGPPPPPT